MSINLLDIIDDELIDDGIDSEIINDYQIGWKDTFGAENFIYKSNITYNEKDIAWWQNSDVGKDLLRIKKPNGIILNWRPAGNHADYGFKCNYIQWFDDVLIVMYRNKHTDYIFRFKDLEVKKLYGGSIGSYVIKNELIYVQRPIYHQSKIFKIAMFNDEEALEISAQELQNDNIILNKTI